VSENPNLPQPDPVLRSLDRFVAPMSLAPPEGLYP
jgi:hypothetical protein